MQDFTALDGAILIDKPTGPTSYDVVAPPAQTLRQRDNIFAAEPGTIWYFFASNES
jgi:hypothetical protein